MKDYIPPVEEDEEEKPKTSGKVSGKKRGATKDSSALEQETSNPKKPSIDELKKKFLKKK
jgi:hypothetical protein